MLLRKKYLVAISLVEMGTAGVPEMAFGLLITMAGPSECLQIWGDKYFVYNIFADEQVKKKYF